MSSREPEAALKWAYIYNRDQRHLLANPAFSEAQVRADDTALISRIMAAHARDFDDAGFADASMWTGVIAEITAKESETMASGDFARVAQMLRHPGGNNLLFGFDDLNVRDKTREADDLWVQGQARWIYDHILRLAEAVGIRDAGYPEAFEHQPVNIEPVDGILSDLDKSFGFRIAFPNLYDGHLGLSTGRGVATFRAVSGLYQAWRLRSLVTDPDRSSVLEIGAGVGHAAFYARHFGFSRYTTVDLPLAAAAQAYFLGTTLGEGSVALNGEENPQAFLSIQSPQVFERTQESYDIALNADSLPEMGHQTADGYLDVISKRCRVFLSINHEFHELKVSHLAAARGIGAISRTPSWLRRGYVEEVFTFPLEEMSGPV